MSGQGMIVEPPMSMPQMNGMAGANGAPPTDQLVGSESDGVPGTLGLTYQRRTKRTPADRHPRIGMVEITVSNATFRGLAAGEEIKITVEDEAGNFEELEGYFGDDDKWHFETKPLYPGIPQIFDATFEVVKTEIKSERKGDRTIGREIEKKVRDLGVRRFRMIPGRTVFLEYP
jgi:hypothetical protein